jgi:hypothetical protein
MDFIFAADFLEAFGMVTKFTILDLRLTISSWVGRASTPAEHCQFLKR